MKEWIFGIGIALLVFSGCCMKVKVLGVHFGIAPSFCCDCENGGD